MKTLLVVCVDPRCQRRFRQLFRYYAVLGAYLAHDERALRGELGALKAYAPYCLLVPGASYTLTSGHWAGSALMAAETVDMASIDHVHCEDHMGSGPVPAPQQEVSGCAMFRRAYVHETTGVLNPPVPPIYDFRQERADHMRRLGEVPEAVRGQLKQYRDPDGVTFATSLYTLYPEGDWVELIQSERELPDLQRYQRWLVLGRRRELLKVA